MFVRNQREIKKHLFIFTNGEKTEREYFEFCRDYLGKNTNYQLIIKPSIKGNIVNLVNTVLKKVKKLKNYDPQDNDEIWLIFDIDEEIKGNKEKVLESIDIAKNNKLNLGWSNKCFELWFLLHFQNTNLELRAEDYHTKLKRKLTKENFEYQKN